MHPNCVTPKSCRGGFSLVAVSIILTVASVLAASMLPGRETARIGAQAASSQSRLQRVDVAMRNFMVVNGRRPCPADGQYAPGHANFGWEAANPGNCTGGSVSAPLGPDSGGYVLAGVIPVRTLGLTDDYALDEYGRQYTYVVDRRATGRDSCISLQRYPDMTGKGAVVIQNGAGGGAGDSTMYAYISHGQDGHGAFPAQGSSVAGRINTGTNDSAKILNAGGDGIAANFTPIRVKKDRTATFSDTVYYEDAIKNTCCTGPKCVPSAVRIDGNTPGQNLGKCLATGDINGDGIIDTLIGGNAGSAGRVLVLFGVQLTATAPVSESVLTGGNGLAISGWAGATGCPLAAGDVNGDGTDDILIGNDTDGTSPIYLVYGHGGPWPSNLSVVGTNLDSSVNPDGVHVTRIDRSDAGYVSFAGAAVAIDDINADGFADMIMSAPYGSNNGWNQLSGQVSSLFTLFGHPSPWPAVLDISNASALAGKLNSTDGFRINGAVPNDVFGYALTTGDLNDDGISDIVVSATGNTATGRSGNNAVYAIYGMRKGGTLATPWPYATQSVTSLVNGTNGFSMTNATTYNGSPPIGMGSSLATGDINGDGRTDVVIGSADFYGLLYPYGGAYVFYQRETMPATTGLNMSYLDSNPTHGFFLYSLTIGGQIGRAVAAGDINRDGIDDVAVSNPGYPPFGAVQILFGRKSGQGPQGGGGRVVLEQLTNGTDGTAFYGTTNDTAPFGGLAIGNVNGDKFKDVLMGAPLSSANAIAGGGSSYVMFGKRKYPDGNIGMVNQ